MLGLSAIPLLGSAAGSVLVAAGQWSPASGGLVIGWLGVVYAIIALRLWMTARARAILAAKGYSRGRAIAYAATVALSGIAWGAAGIHIDPVNPLGMVLTITGLQAMVMGGVLALSASMPVFLAFAVPCILPMVVTLALGGTAQQIVLSLFNLVLLMLMIGVAARFNRSARQNVQLTFEKEDLVEALTKAHDGLAVLARTDGLTGLANRRRFDEMLDAEFARLRRSRQPLSLILLDVDHFKRFNDTYGHLAGDECLRRIGTVFGTSLNRAPDFPARYGGEEFAAILPDTDHKGALALAESIRAGIEALGIAHAASASANCVTASLGVVTVDCAACTTPSEAVKMADEQLYRAKSEGRNRVAGWNSYPATVAVQIT